MANTKTRAGRTSAKGKPPFRAPEKPVPVADDFAGWLQGGAPHDPAHLVTWLRGRKLPALLPDTPPHVFLQESLPQDCRIAEAKDQLAGVLQPVLEAMAQGEMLQDEFDATAFLDNLFMICAFTERPGRLAEPLERALEAAAVQRFAKESDYVRSALLNALRYNDDGRFTPLWHAIMDDKHPFLHGPPEDALYSLVWAAVSAGDPIETRRTRLGEAVKRYGERAMAEFKPWRPRARKTLEMLQGIFVPGVDKDAWIAELLYAADAAQWPRALLNGIMPGLVCRTKRGQDDGPTIVWRPVWEAWTNLEAKVATASGQTHGNDNRRASKVGVLCKGELVEIFGDAEVCDTLIAIAQFMDEYRLNFPHDSSLHAIEAAMRPVIGIFVETGAEIICGSKHAKAVRNSIAPGVGLQAVKARSGRDVTRLLTLLDQQSSQRTHLACRQTATRLRPLYTEAHRRCANLFMPGV